jgi:hypothetical protein
MLTRKPGIPNVRALDVRHINAAVEAIKKRLEAVEAYALTLPTTAQVVQQTETQIVRTQTSAPPASGGPVDAEDLVARFGWNHGEESTRADADSDVHALIWRDEAPRFALPPGITFVWPGPTSTIPSGFILCDNALLQIADYPGLFAAIGVTWGGDGINNFRAPNAQDRYFMGATGGSPAGTLLGNANHGIDRLHAPARRRDAGDFIRRLAFTHGFQRLNRRDHRRIDGGQHLRRHRCARRPHTHDQRQHSQRADDTDRHPAAVGGRQLGDYDMSAEVRPLIQGVYATTSSADYLTVGSGEKVRIEKFTVTNESASSATITISLVPTGATPGNEHRVVVAETIGPSKTRDFSELRHALRGGDKIRAIASANTAMSMFASGTVFT